MLEVLSLQDITFVKLLGKGGYGEASLYTLNSDPKKTLVVKTINKDRECGTMIDREILAGRTLNHKHIAKFYSNFHDTTGDHLAFEYVEGLLFLHLKFLFFRNRFI
jgi:serine/threonine protein kinase